MRFIYAILLATFVLCPFTVSATDRYLDCAGGSDAAAGTSQGTAWLTITKYRSSAGAGDVLFLKKGTTCTATTTTEKLLLKGGIGTPYGSGDKPIIDCLPVTTQAFRGCVEATDLTGITVQELEILPGMDYAVLATNCDNCIFRNLDIHDQASSATQSVLVGSTSSGALLEGIQVYDTKEFRISGPNAIVQDSVLHDNTRCNCSVNPASGQIWRRNTIVGGTQHDDPLLYYTGGGSVEFDSNAVLLEINMADTTGSGIALNVEPLGPVGTRYIRNANVHHNLVGYVGEKGVVGNILAAVATDPANSQLIANNTWAHNTAVKVRCCGSTYGDAVAFRMDDARTPTDATDYSANTMRDNLYWETGALDDVSLKDGIALATCANNLYQTGATFSGAANCQPGSNNNISTGTNPFQSFSVTPESPIGNPQNFNLSATSAALNVATDGTSIGAFQPPQIVSAIVSTATPTILRVSWTTPFPIEVCTSGSFTVSLHGPVLSCALVSNTVVDLTLTSAFTAGQSATVTASQGAVNSKTIGCGTARCQAMVVKNCAQCTLTAGTVRNETYWKHESLAATAFSITNNVDGAAPTVVRTSLACHGYDLRETPFVDRLDDRVGGVRVVVDRKILYACQFVFTIDATANEAYKLSCSDNGGAGYTPMDEYDGHWLKVAKDGDFPSISLVNARPSSFANPGTTFVTGALIGTSGSYPTSVKAQNTDTIGGWGLQVSPSATVGQNIVCNPVTDQGVSFNAHTAPLTINVVAVKSSGL